MQGEMHNDLKQNIGIVNNFYKILFIYLLLEVGIQFSHESLVNFLLYL
jgi:hypothetical protein